MIDAIKCWMEQRSRDIDAYFGYYDLQSAYPNWPEKSASVSATGHFGTFIMRETGEDSE